MPVETKYVGHCLACGSACAEQLISRGDGVMLMRCQHCRSIYLENIPVTVADLYDDNYFALTDECAQLNQDERVGYEHSYEHSYYDVEFYWAARLADFAGRAMQGDGRARRCLDIGAATGRLLNVLRAAGYDTHGVEFSGPARRIAEGRGHSMTQQPVEALEPKHDGFHLVTALEVIEHVEDLRGFFSGIHRVMADNGLFLGYFPSADERWFGATSDYHWLHNSFEHLVYPSEQGIRRAMADAFGDEVFAATFLTAQQNHVIPNAVVIGLKNPASANGREVIAELFRQLRYLTAPQFAFAESGPSALAAGWRTAIANQTDSAPVELPFVASLLCAKFGAFSVPQFLMQCGFRAERLSDRQILDLLAMAMHQGGVHFMQNLLGAAGTRPLLPGIKDGFQRVVDDYVKNSA